MDNTEAGNIDINVKGEKIVAHEPTAKEPKKVKNGKKIFGIITLAIGIMTLTAGAVFLLLNLLKAPAVRDADYLVQVGDWQMKDEPAVIWDFKGIGKGSLTTNSHVNDYDFIWAIEGNSLKIETSWLYSLNDEYEYELNQKEKTLVLTSGEETFTFVPVEHTEEGEESTGEKENSAEEN